MQKIYRISQDENPEGFETAIVVTDSEETAKYMHPGYGGILRNIGDWSVEYLMQTWTTHPVFVKVEFIGETTLGQQILVCGNFPVCVD